MARVKALIFKPGPMMLLTLLTLTCSHDFRISDTTLATDDAPGTPASPAMFKAPIAPEMARFIAMTGEIDFEPGGVERWLVWRGLAVP